MQELVTGIIASIIATYIVSMWFRYRSKHAQNIFLKKLNVETSPFFADNMTLQFDKINYFYGRNASGKTTIAEWIMSLENGTHLERWLNFQIPIVYSMELINNSKVSNFRIRIEKGGVNYFINNSKFAVSPISCKTVYLEQKRIDNSNYNSVEYLAKHLSISSSQFTKLIEQIGNYPTLTIKDVKITENESKKEVLIKLDKRNKWVSFYFLSGSEQHRVILELGLMLSISYSNSYPTILIIEQSSFCLDREYFSMFIEHLSKNKYSFQLFILSVEEPYFKKTKSTKAFVFTNNVPEIQVLEL